MAKPSLKNKWLYNLKAPKELYAQNTKTSAWDYSSFWLGRSCGCRLMAGNFSKPRHVTGIVVYEGIQFKDMQVEGRRIDHVETKNGPLTIVSDLKYNDEYQGSKSGF